MWWTTMKRPMAIFLSLLIIATTVIAALNLFSSDKDAPLAKKGAINLTSWKFTDTSTLPLDGEWEFYPDLLLVPQADKDVFQAHEQEKQIVQVPAEWKEAMGDEESSDGVGTYRLRVELPADALYGIKTNKIIDANQVYLNGHLAGESGVVSEDPNEYVQNIDMYVGVAPSEKREMEIVFHVASFNSLEGGIVNSIDFGTQKGVTHLRDLHRSMDTLLIGGYIVLTFIFFFLFMRNKQERYYLFFSLLTLSVAIHLSLMNERILNIVIPNLTPAIRLSMQLSIIQFAALCFLWFAYDFFERYANRKIVMFITVLVGFHTSLYVIPPLRAIVIGPLPMVYKQLLVVILPGMACLYVIVILWKAFLQKQAESEYVFIIMSTFLSYGLILTVDFLFNIPVGQMPIILFAIMILFLALLMASRTDRTNKQIRQLSNHLLIQDRIKDEFLAKASMQLDQPLKKIKYISKALMEGKESPLKKAQQKDVMVIYRVSQRLEYIVSDLLNASEIKLGKIAMEPQPTRLTVLQDVVDEMQIFRKDQAQVPIICDVKADLPPVLVDEQRLKQIVFTLLQNALFYTNEGSVTLAAHVLEDQMHIVVRDTGVGMDEETLQHIFTTFYRGENNVHADGLGLGLAIAKQLVELSNGSISASSTKGKGSSFTVTLPLAHRSLAQQAEGADLPRQTVESDQTLLATKIYPYTVPGQKTSTILLTGHDEQSLDTVISMIKPLGYEVIVTNQGNSTMEIIDKKPIDLLIVDGKLQDIPYENLYNYIREKHEPIELPVIKLLPFAQFGMYEILSEDYQAELLLNKPVNKREIIEGMESLLAMKASAKKSLHDELSFFYAQIIPHFLYNTLNTIIGLTYIDSEKTREALQYLAIYFRAKLNFYGRGEMIPLERELELVEAYTAIEAMRFGDKLQISMEIDESIYLEIPPLTLQPLVENAIEHGLLTKEGPGKLLVSVQGEGNQITIIIADDGLGMDEEKRQALLAGETSGIGFKNAVQRLSMMKNLSFTLDSAVGKGTQVKIIIDEDAENESNDN